MACSRARAAGVLAQKYAKAAKRRRVCPLITAASKYEKSHRLFSHGGESTVRPSGAKGADGLGFCYTLTTRRASECRRGRGA